MIEAATRNSSAHAVPAGSTYVAALAGLGAAAADTAGVLRQQPPGETSVVNGLVGSSQAGNGNAPLREVLALLPVGVLLLDAVGRVQDANPVAIDLLGVPLLGQRWRDVIARSFEPRADDGHEVSLRDGRRVQIATRAMSDGMGQLVMISDLTETRRLQARLAQRDRLASIGHLLASLSHQLRTPIASALLCAHQLQKHVAGEAVPTRHAARVIERLQHMERQIADMLLVAGGGSPKVELLSAAELLDRVFDLYAPLAQQHGVVLSREGEAPDCFLIGNRDALIGALGNLLDNAFHACQRNAHGSAKVSLAVSLPSAGQITLTITDNGCGMSPSVLARLREPFFTTKRTGTGLGLAVVQAVADSHQAQLAISSTAGVGSCFALTLPLASNALARAG